MRESSPELDKITLKRAKQKLTMPELTTRMLFHNTSTCIGSARAIPQAEEYELLMTKERETRKPVFDEGVCESARSTTDDEDFEGWDTELRSGVSQVPYFGNVVTHQNFWVKKRSKRTMKGDVLKTVIPNPIPRTWARRIKPLYVTGEEEEKSCRFCKSLTVFTAYVIGARRHLFFNLQNVRHKFLGRFDGIYLNWKWQSSQMDDGFSLHDFVCLCFSAQEAESFYCCQENLHLNELMDSGMLFVWIKKTQCLQVMRSAAKMGFRYRESLTWVKQNVANRIITEPSPFFNKSSEKMLIFRRVNSRGKNVRFELGHQRNCDTHLACVRKDPGVFVWVC